MKEAARKTYNETRQRTDIAHAVLPIFATLVPPIVGGGVSCDGACMREESSL